ncbi:MAG TPA: nitroreductase family protein [Ilumatobacteraceae bacterium]
MELIDALRSTASARRFTDQAVDDTVVAEILDDARFAPSGGNRQPWRVAVIKNTTTRRRLADLMTVVWHEYVGQPQDPAHAPFAFGRSAGAAPIATPNELLDDIERVPVVLAVAADLRKIALMDGQLQRPPMTGGASIYPFCWSILLAARARGLGGVMTTFLSRAEVDATEVLALPTDHALVATVFLGHPTRVVTKLSRNPVSTFATVDRFDGPSLT